MKEKPILFNTEMVKSIIAGNKTQTRRIAKGHFLNSEYEPTLWSYMDLKRGCSCSGGSKMIINRFCPYEIGQTLWVRETFTIQEYPSGSYSYIYKADELSGIQKTGMMLKWKSSIYMPRKAARIFLKITNIRIERIQDISEEDAKAEGTEQFKDFGEVLIDEPIIYDYRNSFIIVWDSINKKRGYRWDLNPYVWVYDFEIIKGVKE